MKTYRFEIDGRIVEYCHESLGQAYREAKADNPSAAIKRP